MAEFTHEESKVTLVVTANLRVNYSHLFATLDTQSEDSQQYSANVLVIGVIPEVHYVHTVLLLFKKIVTLCTIKGLDTEAPFSALQQAV